MKYHNGKEMTEDEKLKLAMEFLSDACCVLFETKHEPSHALAFMVDSALKYAHVIYHGDDVLMASADYTAYEQSKLKDLK